MDEQKANQIWEPIERAEALVEDIGAHAFRELLAMPMNLHEAK